MHRSYLFILASKVRKLWTDLSSFRILEIVTLRKHMITTNQTSSLISI